MNKTLTVSKAGACLRLIKIVPHPRRLELPSFGAGVTSPCFPLSYPNSEISNILAISDLRSASFGRQVTVLRRPWHVA